MSTTQGNLNVTQNLTVGEGGVIRGTLLFDVSHAE